MEDAPRIAAIIAHYRDPNAVSACIDALRASSCEIDLVLIVDNSASHVQVPQWESLQEASRWTDGVVDGQLGRIDGSNAFVLRSTSNQGPGAAFAAGMRIAMERGMDAAWILDQDMRPEADCLPRLVEALMRDADVAIPQRVNGDGIHYRQFSLGRWRTKVLTSRNTTSPTQVQLAVYSGMLIRLAESVPAMIPHDYFIDGDDLALCARLAKSGRHMVFVPSAIARHESGSLRRSALGWPVGGWAPFRYYYVARNSRFVRRELATRHPGPALWNFIRTWLVFGALAVLSPPRRIKVRNLGRGWVDGGRQIRGKQSTRALGSPIE